MPSLNGEHQRIDFPDTKGFADAVPIQFVVLQQRIGDTLDRLPRRRERLARDVVVAVDLTPDFLVVQERGAEDIVDHSAAVAFVEVLELVAEGGIDSTQEREPDLVAKLPDAAPREHVLRCVPRKVDLDARAEAIRQPQPVVAERMPLRPDADVVGRVPDGRAHRGVARLVVGETSSG